MKHFFIALFVLTSFCNFAQNSDKTYRYVIVPVQYAFTSEPNQFQINVLTRVLLQQEGFEVYMNEGEELPQEVAKNQCLALKANVVKDKGLFTSNLRFQLFNCYGNLVFESAGSSREKDYKEAYQEALRDAFLEFESVSYKYVNRNLEDKTKSIDITEEQDLPFEERAIVFTNAKNSYWLLKEGQDYILYLDKGETIMATLKKADTGTYAYDSEDIDGAAYFTADGDLVIEYLAKNKDAVQELVYKRQ